MKMLLEKVVTIVNKTIQNISVIFVHHGNELHQMQMSFARCFKLSGGIIG